MFGKPSDNKKIAVAQSDSSDDEPKKNQAPAKKGPPAKKGAAPKESSSSSEEEVIIPVQRSEAEIQKQKDANRARLEEIKKKRELDALKK